MVRIAETAAEETDQSIQLQIGVAHVEALIALGRLDEAEAVLRRIVRDDSTDWDAFVELQSTIDLARGNPSAAATVLSATWDKASHDPRRLASAASLTALVGVSAHELGQHETAAILFGHSAAELERLDIHLRPFDHRLVERAVADCRKQLGDERFAELAEQGAALELRDLPRVKP